MKFICMYADYLDTFRELSDVRRGRLIMAIMEYAFSGKELPLGDRERMAFIPIRNQLDRDREKYEETCRRNREVGKRGGRPRKTQVVSEKPIEKEREKEKINEKEKDNQKEKESCILPEPPQPFDIPSYEDIQAFCLQNNLFHVDPMKFYDYYTANGWRMGRGAMADWTAALRSWDRKDRESSLGIEAPDAADLYYAEFKREYGIL